MNQVLQTLLAGGAVGAIAGLIGVLVAQRRTTERQRQTLLEARNLEANRAQENALQNYFEEMGKLVADPTRPLRSAKPGDDLSALARAQTLSTLERFNNPLLGLLGNDVQYNNRVRKGILLRFLYESGLINRDKPVVDLFDVNLAGVMWLYATLRGTGLRGADLSGAILGGADLNGADLTRADLTGAALVHADLREANLCETDLTNADLKWADLRGAEFGEASLDTPKLGKQALSKVDFTAMMGTDLTGADLSGTDLGGAFLPGAILRDANLRGADLRKTSNLTEEQVDQAHTDEKTQLPITITYFQRDRGSNGTEEQPNEQ